MKKYRGFEIKYCDVGKVNSINLLAYNDIRIKISIDISVGKKSIKFPSIMNINSEFLENKNMLDKFIKEKIDDKYDNAMENNYIDLSVFDHEGTQGKVRVFLIKRYLKREKWEAEEICFIPSLCIEEQLKQVNKTIKNLYKNKKLIKKL